MNTTPLPISADHPAFAGHFPGEPLLPGALLLAEVLEAVLCRPGLAERLGAAPTVAQVKFLAPVRPGDVLSLRLLPATADRLGFEITNGVRIVASGQFGSTAARPAALA